MTIPTITINNDVRCPQCGQWGACKTNNGEYGPCLACAAKNLERRSMKNTQEMVKAEVVNLIETEWEKLIKAYQNSGCELGISIKVGLQGNYEVIELITGLEYYPLPKTKIKTDPIKVDERQNPLPLSV